MKKLVELAAFSLLLMLLCPLVSSCSDDKEPKIELSVSPNNINLLSDKNSSATFSITAGSSWTARCDADWITLSAMSGTGTTNVTITALSMNDTSKERTATIMISCDGDTETINVSQLGAYSAKCKVEFVNPLPMTNSVAFEYQIGSDVSYFYAGYLEVSSAGWSDDKIVNALTGEDRFEPNGDDTDGVIGFSGMSSNTTYYLCAIAFDSKGNRGELTREKLTTLSASSTDPWVYIRNISYNSTTWYWDTVRDVYTPSYYMMSIDGILGWAINYVYNDAQIAWLFKDAINDGDLMEYFNDGEWYGTRSSGSDDLFVATWGLDKSSKFSSQINRGCWSVDSSSEKPIKKVSPQLKKVSVISSSKLKEIKEHTQVFKMK